MIIKWSWWMGLWCLCCTFLKWSGSEACANQGRSRWAAAPANESNSTPTVTIPKLQRTLAVLLHWVGNYIQYMNVYDTIIYYMYLLQLGLVFFYSPWHFFWLHETQKFRHKASEDIIANSFNLSKSLKHLSKRHINHIHHFQYWLSLNIIDLSYLSWPTSIIAFHIFPHVSTVSSVFIRFPSPALQTCPSCPRGQAWLWAPCWAVSHSRMTGVTKMWQDGTKCDKYQTSIKQVSNIYKYL